MSRRHEVVDEVHVGGREQVPSEWKTIRAVFHNFAELPSKRGDMTQSPVLECHGFKWTVGIYPGGSRKSSEENVTCSIFLYSRSCSEGNNIKVAKVIRTPSAFRSVGSRTKFLTHSMKHNNWGHEYALRSDILDPLKNYLVNGNLTVEVDIQVMLDKPPTWTPKNNVCSDMLKLLDTADADNSDVVFEVMETPKQSKKGEKGEEKSHPHAFYAHRNILSVRCPTLEALAEDCSPGTPIPIKDVDPDMFRMLLRFIYGGEVPGTEVLKSEGRSIIRAADEYGCTGLKLAAEAELASAGITTENAAHLILFADGMNCALLKETAMDYFVKNAQAVMESDGFEQVKESPAILTELMAVGFGGSKKRPASPDANADRDYKRMRVATLRQKLDEKELDVDGSKEVLVLRLEAAEAKAAFEAAAEAAAAQAEEDNSDNGEEE